MNKTFSTLLHAFWDLCRIYSMLQN